MQCFVEQGVNRCFSVFGDDGVVQRRAHFSEAGQRVVFMTGGCRATGQTHTDPVLAFHQEGAGVCLPYFLELPIVDQDFAHLDAGKAFRVVECRLDSPKP